MTSAHIDFETRGAVDLKETGAYVYAEDPTTDVWCMAWAIGDEPVRLWLPSDEPPQELFDHIAAGREVVAHNAAFERIFWGYVMHPRYGWPALPLTQLRCTMVQALAMSLPGSLENAAAAVNLTIGKDMAGHRLMMQMARPRKIVDDEGWKAVCGMAAKLRREGNLTEAELYSRHADEIRRRVESCITWWDVEEKKQRLYDYCKQDVEVERELDKRLVKLRASEQKLWWFDQRINDRGVFVDQPLCRSAIKIVDQAKAELDKEMSRVTDFGVTGVSNRNQLVTWLKSRGIETDSVAKDQINEMLARNDLQPDVRRALELRREGARASVAKYDALLAGVSRDGRAKGGLQFHATTTGRWAGRRWQFQNVRRPANKDHETLASVLGRGDHTLVAALYEDVTEAVSDGIRSAVAAQPGRKLVAADFANIEGRVAAWFAGESWKIEAFRAFDRGEGHDLYKLAYGKSFGVRPEKIGKEDPRRQIGKVMELSLQYQGGHGAFVAMGANYGVHPADMVPIVRGSTATDSWAKAEKRFRPQNSFGMSVDEWVALRIVIDGWRASHPAIKQCWKDLEDAARAAVENRGATYSVGAVKFRVSGSFLWMRLPSGRSICFPNPCIKQKKMPWEDDDGNPVYKETLCYMGVDSFTKQWSEQYAYGGQIFNYVIQGTARDILAEAMFRVEQAGYPVILTVHDEIVAEPLIGHGSAREFEEIMSVVPDWAEGCPITADGWQGRRYHK